MKNLSVITGDIVRSTRVYGSGYMLRNLKSVFLDLEDAGLVRPGMWEVFRGDSFQLLPSLPAGALRVALILRTGLIARVLRPENRVEEDEGISSHYDARLAIGFGAAGNLSEKISESGGEAFELSGKRLDAMKAEQRRLAIACADNSLSGHLDISSLLADVLVSSWSESSALAVYRQLLYGETQQQTAAFLQITQPSVQNRLKIAHFDEIKRFISYFEVLINARSDDGIR